MDDLIKLRTSVVRVETRQSQDAAITARPRRFVRRGVRALRTLLIGGCLLGSVLAASADLNVLFVAVDDLRNCAGAFGDPLAKTPNLDSLAKRGTVFRNAHRQIAICNPSRASVMTGMRPDTIKVWGLAKHFRQDYPEGRHLHIIRHLMSLNKSFNRSWSGIPFLFAAAILFLCAFDSHAQLSAPVKRPNILMIVADDMNWDSPGCFGGGAKGITPNIDKLASEGMRLVHAYVNISICTPSRSVMLTGLYPHRNGAEGFQRIHSGTPTLPALLNEAGYLCGTVGKPLSQEETFRWSVAYRWPGAGDEDQWGRDPAVYRNFSRQFFSMAKTAHQPFFLMASSHDPHHPFGRGKATRKPRERADASRVFRAGEVNLPGLLPDLPGVREEYAKYCTSVRRLDDMTGTILEELSSSGLSENTIVLFLSDHGMDFPGAKFQCYPDSVRTPLIVRWPGMVKAGAVDRKHMVSMIDLQSTLLEAVGLEPVKSDGRSFLPLMRGEAQEGRDAVFAQFHHIHGKDALPMRSVITREAAYVFNPWSNGERRFGRLGGPVVAAMRKAAENDSKMAARIRHLELRTVEEFFDLETDPHCFSNLIGSEKHGQKKRIDVLRAKLRAWMVETRDPALQAFDRRDRPEALEQFILAYRAAAQKVKDEIRSYEKRKGYRF